MAGKLGSVEEELLKLCKQHPNVRTARTTAHTLKQLTTNMAIGPG